MLTLGIDIGTTSICAVLYDPENGAIRKAVNRENNSDCSASGRDYLQDPEGICRQATEIVEELLQECPVGAIGVTGQMHGIVYTDARGQAVSPLYTWKDGHGDEIFLDGCTYAQYLTQQTGYPLFTGYGITTHFYCQTNGLIPGGASAILTIPDYLALRLTGGREVKTDPTMAASMGAFRMDRREFDTLALQTAGVDISFLPGMKKDRTSCGTFRGIPVFTAIGDNQASFLAATEDIRRSVCVNVGTGSQVSVFSDTLYESDRADIRPFPETGCLYVGASLNGGKAYALLGEFFGEICREFAGASVEPYEVMNRMAQEGGGADGLAFAPLFYGGRGNEASAASIQRLRPGNFHAPQLVRACIAGMAAELYEMYLAMPEEVREGRNGIYCSGNGIRRNQALQREVERLFGMPVKMGRFEEEAAAGAAIWAWECAKE